MKHIFLFVLFLSCCFISAAQIVKIDSLKGNWKAVAVYDPQSFYYNSLNDSLMVYDKKALGLPADLMADDSIRAAANKLFRLIFKRQIETMFLMCDAKGNASFTYDGNTVPFIFSEKNQRAEAGKKVLDMKLSFQNGILVINNYSGNAKSVVWLKKDQ